jgi:hypothetical protein
MGVTAKGRKIGRNKASCEQYRREEKREKSKARRLLKHLRFQPDDARAKTAFDALPGHIKDKAEKRRAKESTDEHSL